MGKLLSESEERFVAYGAKPEEESYLPPPPYQVGNVHLKFIGIRLAKGAARALLPPELEPADSNGGLICVYSAGSGSVVAPFSACYAAVEVKGFNAPDGSAGYYIAAGYYSGGGGAFMRRYYNLNVLDGSSRQFKEGDVAVGVGGQPGIDALEVRLRPGSPPPFAAGVHHYLGKRPGGGSTMFPIAFSGIITPAEPLSVKISDAAIERLRLARPAEMTFATECTEGSLTFGVPQPVGEPYGLVDTAAQSTLLNAFARLGRATLIVTAGGEVRNMSDGARSIMGDGVTLIHSRLRTTRPEAQRELDRLVDAATGESRDRPDLPPIRLERSSAGPLIVDVVPIGSAATGQPSALVLLNDPAVPTTGNIGAGLQLLGLTPAEARIAELVGSGESPRRAAAQVGNAESTVRTSLARIYQKLQINRQSELARIVARL